MEIFILFVTLSSVGSKTLFGQHSPSYYAEAFSFSNNYGRKGVMLSHHSGFFSKTKHCVPVSMYFSSQKRFNMHDCRRRNYPTSLNPSAALSEKKESTEEDLSLADRVEASSVSTTLPDSPVSAAEDHNNDVSSRSSIHSSSSSISNSSSSSSEKSDTELDKVTKTLNAILLAASFGWAIYTILKVDAGMTRGWTQQEIMMRIPIDNWRSYENNLNSSPIETKTLINVIIYLLGDWLSQTIFQRKNILDFDASRTIKNGFIGLCFGPLVHEYYEFSDRILPLDVDINRLYKIIMDQTIYLAIKCSIYIIAVGLLSGSTLQESIENVKNRIKTVMFTAVRMQNKCFRARRH